MPSQADITEVKLSPSVWRKNEFYGKSEIHRKQLAIPIMVNQTKSGATLMVTYQDCVDIGFCCPPKIKTVPLSEVPSGSAAAPTPALTTVDPQEKPQPTIQLPLSASWVLLIGVGIAFTPCILPIYPLISGIVLGGKQRLLTGRALLLVFTYVQGIALTYTALDLAVVAAGLQFQAALQHPYVPVGLAVIFTLLALSMFSLFTLQLSSSL